ncbi:Membrane protein related to metalloendopeptidase [Hahella chejuensis KCTC 2396]|uniref:Membrane protein related to metalloendopeptidase n=1 Tax=Hahella chejuensis (strain KCTC 2396) TaxID=349521 RepID=Q2SLB8_HAHCH|nr:peptidoglycan DD-metalloendopeptidase family protein [Hahella chejuensis]ABC28556.1 Membrane protein related to metalloendopeptidase [Hahella chejuensis KCTC 2396]
MKIKGWRMVLDHVARSQQTLALIQIIFGLIALAGLYWFSGASSQAGTSQSGQSSISQVSISQQRSQEQMDGAEQAHQARSHASEEASKEEKLRDLQYMVEPGDTLEAIFRKSQFPITELYEILEADEPYLALDVLRPGDRLSFRIDPSNKLYALSLVVDPSKTVSYLRGEDGRYVYDETLTPTAWITEVVRGEVSGSFFVSASNSGLSENMVMTIHQLLKNTLNFRRDLRAGDQFQVVIEREVIDGIAIGHDRLLAARINARRKEFGAYLHGDGSYYDADGSSLIPALLRYPTQKRFRISSPFNPRRLHPVTGRYAPHNGVDFAMPVGSPVISTGNGRVTRVANHRYAGKYIAIDEFGPYSARYLRLSKILVTKGQLVERGQVIALSGNTGRSTGPHLHYELHIKGKPVNPMTADIPVLQSIPAADIASFRMHVQSMQTLMLDESQIAKRFEHPASGSPQATDPAQKENL